jgi:hypothetical protein
MALAAPPADVCLDGLTDVFLHFDGIVNSDGLVVHHFILQNIRKKECNKGDAEHFHQRQTWTELSPTAGIGHRVPKKGLQSWLLVTSYRISDGCDATWMLAQILYGVASKKTSRRGALGS